MLSRLMALTWMRCTVVSTSSMPTVTPPMLVAPVTPGALRVS
jgi:hypothetical protein